MGIGPWPSSTMSPMRTKTILALLTSLSLPALSHAQTYPPGNLLANPDFENGLTGWNQNAGSFQVFDYGTPFSAPTQVGIEMGGGMKMVSATGYGPSGQSAIAELAQGIDLTQLEATSPGLIQLVDASNLALEFSAWQGGVGSAGVNSRLLLRFYNGSSSLLRMEETTYYATANRNGESTMAYRRGLWSVPPQTRYVEAAIFYSATAYSWGYGYGFADNASLVFQPSGAVPLALPLDANLVVDGDFERTTLINPGAQRTWLDSSGSAVMQPDEGWRRYEGTNTRSAGLVPYGSAAAPSPLVGLTIGGGNRFLCSVDVASYISVQQDIDLRGNSADIQSGSLFLDLEGFFGTPGYPNVRSALIAEFYFAQGGTIPGGTVQVAGPLAHELNGEASMIRRFARFPVPTLAGSMSLRVLCYQASGTICAIDNVSAVLRRNPSPSTPVIGQNLLANGDFESGPNQLITPLASWTVTRAAFSIVPYGLTAIPFSRPSSMGGQQYLLRSTANDTEALTQTFDLSGHAGLIDTFSLGITLSGWLGGVGTDPDDASLRVVYRNAFGGPVPSLINGANNFDETDQVLPADRQNVTDIVYRESSFTVPPGTRTIDVQLRCNRRAGTNDALADVVSAVLQDLGTSLHYPGTGGDLELLTGVNALPSGGLGADIKTAPAGATLAVSVRSPQTTLNFAPLLLAVEVLPTGSQPVPIGFGIQLNPASPLFVIVLNPISPGLFPPIVIPGGTNLNFVLPASLAGASLFWQGVALPPAGITTTDAHEIRVQ